MIKTLVLIHSPLVGPMTWQSVAVVLKRQGYRVVTPSLAGIFATGPPYHEKFAAAAASAIERSGPTDPVGLVAHSGAGSLIPSIVAASKVPAAAVLFVDATLPHPGQSWTATLPEPLRDRIRSLATEGWLPPWNEWFPSEMLQSLLPDVQLRDRFVGELPRGPLDYFAEPAPDASAGPKTRSAYIQLSAAYQREAEKAERLGWPTRHLTSDHLAMLTQPREIAEAIRSLCRELAG